MTGIKIDIVAAESLGVRSMSTFVETPDITLLIDPGLALGPRFRLLPHPIEYRYRNRFHERLQRFSDKADLMVITHYHHDHYIPGFTDTVWIGSDPHMAEALYQDKTLLVKNYRDKVNPTQRRRGWIANRWIQKYARNIEVADGRSLTFGDTHIKISPPVYHGGKDSALGWVLMVYIMRGEESFLFASDVQGPLWPDTVDLILEDKPCLLFLGGPPLYLREYRITLLELEKALQNMSRLIVEIPHIIIDHHLLRSMDWKEYLNPIYETAQNTDHTIYSAAEFSNLENSLLESHREDLYRKDPPDREFMKWTQLPKEERRLTPPPL